VLTFGVADTVLNPALKSALKRCNGIYKKKFRSPEVLSQEMCPTVENASQFDEVDSFTQFAENVGFSTLFCNE